MSDLDVTLDGVVDVDEVNEEILFEAMGEVEEFGLDGPDWSGEHGLFAGSVNAAKSVEKVKSREKLCV